MILLGLVSCAIMMGMPYLVDNSTFSLSLKQQPVPIL